MGENEERPIQYWIVTMSAVLGEDADMEEGAERSPQNRDRKKFKRGLELIHNYHPHLVSALYALDTVLTRSPDLT